MTEQEFKNKYYGKVSEQTLETLPDFLNEILNKVSHDYGSICCAVAASGLAAAYAANKSKQGGITGFQAGAVMWEFISEWQYRSNKCGLKMIDYDNMLYSQYESDYQKTISKGNFEALQKEAQRKLDEDKVAHEKYLTDCAEYNKALIAFKQKYPDFLQDPKKYERISSGTCEEWAEEERKEKAGFEFAPNRPCYFRGQIEHWQSIVDGVVPFGYLIKED